MNNIKLQSSQSIIISAPIDKVWSFNQDLSKIPQYHPRVQRVEIASGSKFRKNGASYTCFLKDGRNSCTEKDVEIIPFEKIVTSMVGDTFGLTKILTDYTVETIFTKVTGQQTKMEFFHFYSSSSLIVKLLNLIIKNKISRKSLDTLKAIKKVLETSMEEKNYRIN